MAETEVESILREIREQVLNEQRLAQANTAVVTARNGDSESVRQTITEDKLTLFDSYLTTTARTWDRLPPVVSNRSGSVARLELWLKRQLKRATRWFTWEQVNFNASVHHALRDLPPILSAYEQELANLREQIKRAGELHESDREQHQTDLLAQRAELETVRQAIEDQGTQQKTQFEGLRIELEEKRIQVSERLAELVSEFRERVSHLQEEQRVSFKQLSLETSEAATLEDRARRKTETLVAELQHRIDKLEQ
jgi:DNA repair exonuclease SbcCD ATPase subunit